MAFKPTAPYRHDGQTLHPKLTYALPAAMEAFLVANGLGTVEAGPADIDMTHLAWESGTKLYQGGGVAPAPIVHPQD